MSTSDIALEKVQALLKVETGNGSLYNHMVQIVHALAAEKPGNALMQLETLSKQLKDSAFVGAAAPDVAERSATEVAAEEAQKHIAQEQLKLVRPLGDATTAPKVLGFVQNYLEDAAMFEWAGVGFGRQESFHIGMSLRKLAAETPGLESLRLWGKILGTQGDYYVAEGTLGLAPSATEPVIPGTPDDDVEIRGQGANTWIYWVSAGGLAPWVRLPVARASQIAASRSIKHLLTGDLNSTVDSTPWFPGQERHLLRSQIARITSTCTLAVRGWYEPDEESGIKNKLKVAEGAADSYPPPEELATQAGWVHAAPCLLSTGKCGWPNLEDFPEGMLTEEQTAKITEQSEAEPEKPLLEALEADLEEVKPEELEGSPAWGIKVYGDEGVYAAGDATKTPRVTAIRSMIWPGAVAVTKGTKFANLYVGYATKCGTLVPPQKDSGLPLRGTMPLMPLAPDDIMDEPQDLEEQEEPNPIQDEAESDKGDEDVEPEE
mmetsp:Transcript_91211/g.162446  ORF Transcript_91211/g.162446 Transcript_91211/m.162446 type:complete len:490 (+) Transcript_91211:51-1520(+)